ncbi:uncharacterized protein LTR77_006069 [Saxophila tyrrhenica]|uniref:Uncharacterized protein n=1 Tax=Saxophila tyrrhenica TaxID=1690608 RepID=A0AAV9PB48_9PEZI|nr:hypothetical protein LTR77_006069 [Saxophila tyrrhenica]
MASQPPTAERALRDALARENMITQVHMKKKIGDNEALMKEIEACAMIDHAVKLLNIMNGTLMSYIATDRLLRAMRTHEGEDGRTALPIPTNSQYCEALLKTLTQALAATNSMACENILAIWERPIASVLHSGKPSFLALLTAQLEIARSDGPIHRVMASFERQRTSGWVVELSAEDMEELTTSAVKIARLAAHFPGGSETLGGPGWRYAVNECREFAKFPDDPSFDEAMEEMGMLGLDDIEEEWPGEG